MEGAGSVKVRVWRLAALSLVALAAAAQAQPRPQQHGPPHEDGVLVLGRVSDNPRDHYAQLRPLLDYVVPRLRDVGIREGRVLMARDAQQMQSYMRRGRVDWITETAGTGMAFAERAGARVMLATERSGVRQYNSVFFARRDSGIRGLADLRGRSIALQNQNSTSAYFAPAVALLDAGLEMEILLSPDDRPAGGSVGYLFARSEANIATWVHKRLVDAGAFSNLDWAGLERMPQSFRDDLVLFHETPPYPRAIELVRGNLDPALAARLREVLLAAADDPEARVPMLHFFNTTRFVPVDDAMERSLEKLAAGVERIRRLLE